jgi:hypothetical protein
MANAEERDGVLPGIEGFWVEEEISIEVCERCMVRWFQRLEGCYQGVTDCHQGDLKTEKQTVVMKNYKWRVALTRGNLS